MKSSRSIEGQIATKRKVIECLECANYSKRSIAFKRRELDELLKQLPENKRK